MFYILDQTVFQAATLGAVLGARSARLLYHLRGAFEAARELYEPARATAPAGIAPVAAEKVEHERATDRLLSNFFNHRPGGR